MRIGDWVRYSVLRQPRQDRSVPPVMKLTTSFASQRVAIPRVTRHNVCNPSVMATPEGFQVIVRGCNYDLGVRGGFFTGSATSSPVPDCQNYLFDLAPDLSIRDRIFIEDRDLRAHDAALDGIEDLRLFEWQGARWVLGAACNFTARRSTMLLARLDGTNLRDAEFLASPLGAPTEKNWSPVVRGRDLFLVYKHHPLRVLRYDGGRLVPHLLEDTPAWLAPVSGSSGLSPYRDGYIGVAHQFHRAAAPFWRVYQHRLIDYGPDFRLRRISPPFCFEHHGVEFCAGLALTATEAVFSYGISDKQAVLARLPLDRLEALLAEGQQETACPALPALE